MRKYLLILITATFLFMVPNSVFAESFSQARTYANKDIQVRYNYPFSYFSNTNAQGKQLNQNTWSKPILKFGSTDVRAFVYGNPWGDYKQGNYRYLGYTVDGIGFTNINFPCDSNDLLTKYIEELDWIEYPWKSKLVQQQLSAYGEGELYNISYFNCRLVNRELVYKGVQLEKNENGRPLAGPGADKVPWEKYVHVYQPPTQYYCGLGRMWNKKIIGGKALAFYKTVVLPPYEFITPSSSHTPPKGEVPGFKGELGGGGGFR